MGPHMYLHSLWHFFIGYIFYKLGCEPAPFLLGFVLDWIEITFIVLPLVAPVVAALGFDLVWFTVLFAVCLQTSFLAPPVGFTLFYLQGVVPRDVQLAHIYRGVIPYVAIQLLVTALVVIFPQLVLWLPGLSSGVRP